MSNKQVFLRPEVKLELLLGRWYVWQHLISPVTRGLNILTRHIPLLQSFIDDPKLHAEACRNARFLGGKFLELPESSVDVVRALLAETNERCAPLLDIAKAVRALNDNVGASAGYSLDSFYGSMPENLRGLVELVYDENHVPAVRLREALVYEDPQYIDVFEEVLLHRTRDTNRKFFLTTPRVGDEPDRVIVSKRFSDRYIDALASARLQPRPFAEVGTELLEHASAETVRGLFTERPPVRDRPDFEEGGVRVRYFGHACVLVQSADTSILIDPRFASERDSALATLTFDDLPDVIDYVVISHAHQDHFCAETLVQLRRRIGQVVVPGNSPGRLSDPSLRLSLRYLGIDNVRVMHELDSISFSDGELVCLPFSGEHCGLDIASKQCLAVTIAGRRFLFLVDSDAVDIALYARLARYVRNADAVFMGMECRGAPLTWLYGPVLCKPIDRRSDQSRRGNASDSKRAWEMVRTIGSSNVFVYAMGMEPWNRHLLGLEYEPTSLQIRESDELLRMCKESGIHAERLKGCREMFF